MIDNFYIAPGTARVLHLDRGRCVRIIDVEGSQVSDVVGICSNQHEWISTAETMNLNFSFKVPINGYFYTNKRRPAIKLVRDDSNGKHDMTNACCSPEFYKMLGADKEHANCHEAFNKEFLEVGISAWDMATPINFFQVTESGPNGKFMDVPAGTEPGTTVELMVLMELWLGISSCPCDIGGEAGSITGSSPTSIRVELM